MPDEGRGDMRACQGGSRVKSGGENALHGGPEGKDSMNGTFRNQVSSLQLEFMNKYNWNACTNKAKVLFVNEGLIRKEVGQKGCTRLAQAWHISKEIWNLSKGTSLKDFNQGSDMASHIFEKIISASVGKMNWMGVKEKLQVLRTIPALTEITGEGEEISTK